MYNPKEDDIVINFTEELKKQIAELNAAVKKINK